jgi:hypothetical protein
LAGEGCSQLYSKKKTDMATFFVFGKYPAVAAREISVERTEKVQQLIENLHGQVKGTPLLL